MKKKVLIFFAIASLFTFSEMFAPKVKGERGGQQIVSRDGTDQDKGRHGSQCRCPGCRPSRQRPTKR